jgi:hypothetical protein
LITVKVYKNGFEVDGHDEPYVCHQVSLWIFICRRILHGIHGKDDKTRSYTSEGHSWLVYNNECETCKWLFDELVIDLKDWCDDTFRGRVAFESTDDELTKVDVS